MNRKVTADDSMPITLPDTSFSQVLNPEDTNRADTRAFLARDAEPFTLPGFVTPFGYTLWQNRAERQFRLVTQERDPETVYAVRLEETEDFTSPERACIQVMVWRTRQPQHEGAVHGLARRFFCHFLHRWSIIITDSAQTNAAKVMWEGMVAWALRDPEHYVYVWDGTGESGCLHPVRSWLAFCGHWAAFCWGAEPESHLRRRVVISTHPLNAAQK
ncbi:hypothetical protein QMZ65_19320 [Pantoea sp. EABMAA-21]|uniref:hypothetical protein n=1 Tax=unclassified Pantoea TaxID=2630326 RepID=UPI000BDAB5D2|nr:MULTISPECIES: hypothetical protein [unclassified Pantoea]MDI9279367.1 hypothetical protein [Pantoea sp. EABMAA-21]MXP54088.1 hypothetical protein [Pantoea sp. Seng]SNY66508.1 hypothetical protein SAMN02744778_02257 [Pantoea sp. GL120224-02]